MSFLSHLPILMAIVPIAVGTLIYVSLVFKRDNAFVLSVLAMMFTFISSLFLAVKVITGGPFVYYVSDWASPWGIEIFIDNLSIFMVLLITFVGLASIVYSELYIKKVLNQEKIQFYYILFLFLTGSLIGFVISGDIFNMFIFFEILSLSSYSLVAISGDKEALRAGFRYLIMGTISSLFILLGLGFIYSVTGTINFTQIAFQVKQLPDLTVIYTGALLLIIAFVIEAAIFPLHVWLPQAHGKAIAPVSAVLSGVVIGTGVFGIIKVIYYIVPVINSAGFVIVFRSLASIGIILGAAFALFEKDLKLLLAQSSISQIGFAALGVFLFSYLGLTGSMLQILNHALAKSALFLCVGAVIYKTGFRKLDEIKGIGKKMPITMGFFTVSLASIASIPLTCGFVSKYYLCLAAIKQGLWGSVSAILLGSFLSLLYCFRIINYIFFEKPDFEMEVKEVPLKMLFPIGALVFLTIFFGIFPKTVFVLIEPGVKELLGFLR
ncbi:proton-conducting transporter membrane subunit [Candidatus Oleimmundimicrobium sp.]|uniref:complex I subunit 5 family protein n=1 Tax=Candidatus Oleimmundimicrobium sp. TaxID=3060597 RepID=UPI00272927C1|nr:proton-conducting transporter membrane subunit [Candidatus Oleimmundimicrobium sp.]MDO8886895.1 proton-conducting transporter membrane subunit [Candidatus Oleimmundimicrobium sp.]